MYEGPHWPGVSAAQGQIRNLCLDSNPMAVRAALETICAGLAETGVEEERILPVEIALAEALNNVVEHAYLGRSTAKIDLSIAVTPTRVTALICDSGVPLPTEMLEDDVPRVLPDTIADLPEGGFGWALLSTLADKLRYRRCGGINYLTLTFIRAAEVAG